MIKVKEQKNIWLKFFVKGNDIFFVAHDFNFYKNNNLLIKGDFSIRSIYKGEIWLFDEKILKTIVYDTHKELSKELDFIIIKIGEFDNNTCLCLIRKNEDSYYGIVNPNKEITLKYEYNIKNIIIATNNLFLSQKDSFIICHSLLEGSEIWQLDFRQFSEEAKIRKVLAVQGRLFVSASAEYSTLGVFEVDITSGKVLFNTLEMGGELFEFENKIYTIWNTYLNILHLDTLRVQTIDFKMVLKPLDLQLDHSRFVVKGNELYFVSQARNERGAYVGILDIEDKKLLWHTEIPIEEGSYWIGDVQVHENRLYVLTQGGTLHIFEKENV